MSNKKLDNAILYFSQEVKFNCKKKLAKLLYFLDFTNYEATSKPLTGLKYQKYTYGPIPYNFYKVLEDMQERELIRLEEKKLPCGSIPVDIVAKVKPDLSVFSKSEMNFLSAIAEKYKNLTAGELEKIAKEEPPYLMVNHKEEIPYHLAFYRNTFGEMDLEDGDTNS